MISGQISTNVQNNQVVSEEIKVVAFQMTHMTQINLIDNSNLNIKKINFLQNLGNYNKVKILCDNQSCLDLFHSSRIYTVL